MFLIVRNDQHLLFGYDGFFIKRIRPGLSLENADDLGLGPLGLIDRITMSPGVVVPLHLHRNDELLSYIMHGNLIHIDDKGERYLLTPTKFMMMSAGRGIFHSESVPLRREPLEMLQIAIRPHTANLTPTVSFHKFPSDAYPNHWRLVAGAENSRAHLFIRNDVLIFDIRFVNDQLSLPDLNGQTAFLYVLGGELFIPEFNSRLIDGDGVLLTVQNISLKSLAECRLILFIVDTLSWFTREGIISG